MKAADLLREDHPLHKALVKFSKGKPTKRKAREFLRAFPRYNLEKKPCSTS